MKIAGLATIDTIPLLHFAGQKAIYSVWNTKIGADTRCVVGVSGGADSMLLSVLLWQYFKTQKYSTEHIHFVHLHHGVRDASDSEEALVRQFFGGAELTVMHRSSHGPATENQLRKRRYGQFFSAMKSVNAELLFLGHHLDDRIETTMLNVLRGCNIQGFLGIKAEESHYLLGGKTVLRPLLNLRKQEIMELVDTNTIPYVQDASNFEASTSIRNQIRLSFLPNCYSQDGFVETMNGLYSRYEKLLEPKNLLISIPKSPSRGVVGAYKLSISRHVLTPQDLVNIRKILQVSGGITAPTVTEFHRFATKSAKGWKTLHDLTMMIAHDELYFFIGPHRFREKTIEAEHKITTLKTGWRYPKFGDVFKGKTRNQFCITQKIPLFWRSFVPVRAQNSQILERDRTVLSSSTTT
ncbi:MAG: tRNA lysidine(34) synthetase TilS [Candidatus Absconditabacteria bacterium]